MGVSALQSWFSTQKLEKEEIQKKCCIRTLATQRQEELDDAAALHIISMLPSPPQEKNRGS